MANYLPPDPPSNGEDDESEDANSLPDSLPDSLPFAFFILT